MTQQRFIPLLGVLSILAGFGLAASTSEFNPGDSGERQLSHWFSDNRNGFLNEITHFIEFVDGPKFIPFLLVALIILGIALKRFLLFATIVLMAGFAWLPGHFAKLMFSRERPSGVDAIITYEDAMSYPSGHMGMATALTMAIVWALYQHGLYRWWVGVLAAMNIVIIGMSRIYAGAHYYLDVVGGFLLAMGAVLLLWAPATALYQRRDRWKLAEGKNPLP